MRDNFYLTDTTLSKNGKFIAFLMGSSNGKARFSKVSFILIEVETGFVQVFSITPGEWSKLTHMYLLSTENDWILATSSRFTVKNSITVSSYIR